MRAIVIAIALVSVCWVFGAAAQDYPKDQFDALKECTIRIHCEVEMEDRISGPVADAGELTYSGICIMGCINVCTKNACWCEADDKCKR